MKYKVKDIVEEATYRLLRVFPANDLDRWDADLLPDGDDTPIALDPEDTIDVIRLARLLNVPSILPLVFYTCCNIPDVGKVADGVEYDGGISRLDPEDPAGKRRRHSPPINR